MPPDINENDAEIRRQKALRRRWIVHRGDVVHHSPNVLTYFARYGRGGPLKESRLVAVDGQTVTFCKNRRHEPYEALTLPVDVFLERLLRHVPPHNFRTLRSCGLYAPNASDKRQRARAALGQPSPAEAPAAASKPDSEAAGHDCCEVCGKKLVLVAKIPRPGPRPPPNRRRGST